MAFTRVSTNPGVTTALFIMCAVLYASSCKGHYNLMEPKPWNPIDCNKPDCMGPCPAIWKSGYGKARNSPQNPSAVWKRGQVVNIRWQRNNHEGGFYRRALVPVEHMYNSTWHKKLSFEWGCWTQGRFRCRHNDSCGTDVSKSGYQNNMEVPSVFPDGDYVFGMIWYGGLHWRRHMSGHSNYYTCAFVKIKGGRKETEEYTPKFVPGFNRRTDVPSGTCSSTSMFVGECKGYQCKKNKVRNTVPGVFMNGKAPPAVLHAKVIEALQMGKKYGDSAKPRRNAKSEASSARTPKLALTRPIIDATSTPEASSLEPSAEPEGLFSDSQLSDAASKSYRFATLRKLGAAIKRAVRV